MAIYSRTHIEIDADTAVEVRPPDRPGEQALLIDEWNRHHQIAVTFDSLRDLDRTIAALTELRAPMLAERIEGAA